jgi:predicted pyridoxine 5'-phosphate oxidase superfamily flavin-nucleotide-binding protein
MAKLDEKAKKAIREIHPAFIATADKNGKPNVSAKGSLSVFDDEHVLFADIASPRTVTNIKENPQVALICLDAASRKSCRIWGKGEIISSGELFDKIAAQIAGMNMKVNNVVMVAVDEVEVS